MSYKQKLLDPRWQKVRLEILNRDSFSCVICHDKTTTLHVHHLKYTTDDPWDAQESDLITCCKHCHSLFEYHSKHKDISIMVSEVMKWKVSDEWTCLFVFNPLRTEYLFYNYNEHDSVINIAAFIPQSFFPKVSERFITTETLLVQIQNT